MGQIAGMTGVPGIPNMPSMASMAGITGANMPSMVGVGGIGALAGVGSIPGAGGMGMVPGMEAMMAGMTSVGSTSSEAAADGSSKKKKKKTQIGEEAVADVSETALATMGVAQPVRKRTKAEKEEAKKAATELLKVLQAVDPAASPKGDTGAEETAQQNMAVWAATAAA
eukprot:CAMPEP_0169264760 /NCGR_PEP_ID=MMETSP1016-20121227/45305_1 /TAXON_ID=342587 /ORGANISM="Karlodinium micrum, Strain CCMP2283" /LENGTH=168 /DNA_ID=CAMNT_0009348159 /DNA_START=1 /DNA_END=504 /DNA_ORIENTATION=+